MYADIFALQIYLQMYLLSSPSYLTVVVCREHLSHGMLGRPSHLRERIMNVPTSIAEGPGGDASAAAGPDTKPQRASPPPRKPQEKALEVSRDLPDIKRVSAESTGGWQCHFVPMAC